MKTLQNTALKDYTREIIDTLYGTPDYSDYKEYCEENEIEAKDEFSNEYLNWVYEMRDLDIDDFWANIGYSKYADSTVFVSGSVKLWYGSRPVCTMSFDGLEEAIRKCISGADDFCVEYTKGYLTVTGYHHDGQNTFYIELANNKGLDLINKCKEEYEDLPEEIPADCVGSFEDVF